MAAAAITPSVVQKSYVHMSKVTGTPVRVVEYYLEATKVTQNDWILLETAIGDTTKTLMNVSGIVLDASSDLVQEGFTYDDSADTLVLTSATVGTVKVTVRMQEA